MKEQTTERPLACSALLLSLSGSCTAPALLLSKLINLTSLLAHEKFISFSGLVNLELSSASNAKGKILKP